MNQVSQYIENTKILKEDVKQITSGPFYKENYNTFKFVVRAPDTAKVDVDSYSIIFAYKGKKVKIQPLIKEAPQSYLQEFQKLVEQIVKETSINNLLIQASTNFDQFLLKLWNYFTRYQAIDETGCTCLRYLFKQECEVAQLAKKTECTTEKQKGVKAQAQSQDIKVTTIQPASQVEDIISTQKTEPDNQQKITTVPTKEFITPVQFRFRTEDELKDEEFRKQLRKEKFKLYDETEIKTLDDFYAEVEEKKKKATEVKLPIFKAQEDINQPVQEEIEKIEVQTSWTENSSKTYFTLIKSLTDSLTKDLLIMSRRYNNFNIQDQTDENLIFSFTVSSQQIVFNASPLLPAFSTLFSEPDLEIPFLINLNLQNIKKSFVRVDPQGKLLILLVQQTRKLPPELIYSIDYCDFQFLSIISREISQIIRIEDLEKPKPQSLEQRAETLKSLNVNIVMPKQLKTISQPNQPIQQPTPQISPATYISQITTLPHPQTDIPLLLNKFSLLQKFNQSLEIFSEICHFSAVQIKKLRVQEYLNNDSDYESDSYEPSTSQSTSSSASIYDSYSQITDKFLANSQLPLPDGLRLSLTSLELENALILQFSKISISAICSKCQKLNVLGLEPGITNVIKPEKSDVLKASQKCKFCGTQNEISVLSRLFNTAFKGQSGWSEPIFVLSHVQCVPVVLSYLNESELIIQCQCGSLSIQNSLQEFSSNAVQGARCRCPNCFKALVFTFENSFFALQNGKQLPLPQNFTKQPQNSSKSLQITNNGTCEHYKSSYRLFKFPCGQAFPCDVCHEKQCGCSSELARIMICGYCGAAQGVQNDCRKCRKSLIKARGTHWEGGNGCRNQTKMSKKDEKKYRGSWKTRSNKERKRTVMQKRGNAKKKEGETY